MAHWAVGMSKAQHGVEVDTHTVAGVGTHFTFLCKSLGFVEDVGVVPVDKYAVHIE